MYCFNFRQSTLTQEEKSETDRFPSNRIMEDGTKALPPPPPHGYMSASYGMTGRQQPCMENGYHRHQHHHHHNNPPSLFDESMEKATIIATFEQRAAHSKHKKRNPKALPTHHEEEEADSRFQKELQRFHRDFTQKKGHDKKAELRKKIYEDDIDDGNGNDDDKPDIVLVETESMEVDGTIPGGNRGLSKSQLKKENHQLKRELRRTTRILECERALKISLRDRLGDLEEQVNQMREEQPLEGYSGHLSLMIHRLQEQVQELQKDLESERTKNQQLQSELGLAKKDNQKTKEKMRLMLFHHIPGATSSFKDIGAVDPHIIESANRVADYEIGVKLGEGHYGSVAEGRNLVTGKKYAIKVLNKERITRFKDLQQVAMEVHVLKKYPHPNIVRTQEVIHASDNLYLITELCLMDLHKYHNDIGLSERGAQEVILGILKPLYHLHSHGICHLDLKPENILLAASVNTANVTHHDVRLCDFGLVSMAKKPEESKAIVRKGYACGTPGFFAPEMILKNEFEGRQADMWSLGCIILELTLGFTQEWIESYEQIQDNSTNFRRVLENCLEEIAPAHYPRHQHLLNIIHRCLSLDPKKRINASEALVHPWLEDVAHNDEGRQDMGYASRGALHSTTSSSSQLYAERSALVAAAIMC